ncbi:Sec-independent protein translocase protein TatB [Atopomonas sediminilitoris]|uniref:Sec-independent protein translocase protein TatB n=1 Tax=Atopomonas sediminilitoris TaxID=2919919 RepID=UPI001F4E932D|nr:Sec-independent protein translocase protein TatB [Atopomonas sediminilitoris]MCJ8168295.1 Sec-independent protein translocase protein TatB [Atopomonas sediminilitoris]
MFDVGFSELLLIAVLALIVLGPERLPVAARMLGLWVGRLKRSFNSVKAEVEREIGADEIRRQLHNERILDMERELKEKMGLEDKPASVSTASAPNSAPANTPADDTTSKPTP